MVKQRPPTLLRLHSMMVYEEPKKWADTLSLALCELIAPRGALQRKPRVSLLFIWLNSSPFQDDDSLCSTSSRVN